MGFYVPRKLAKEMGLIDSWEVLKRLGTAAVVGRVKTQEPARVSHAFPSGFRSARRLEPRAFDRNIGRQVASIELIRLWSSAGDRAPTDQ